MKPQQKKNRVFLKTLGLAAAGAVAIPFMWGAMMYGRASHFAFKYYKTTLAAAVLAGGIYYVANSDEAQQYVKGSFENIQQQYVEHTVGALEERIQELENEKNTLKETLQENGQIDESNKKFYLGLGAGTSVTLLGLAAYGFSQRTPPKPRVRTLR